MLRTYICIVLSIQAANVSEMFRVSLQVRRACHPLSDPETLGPSGAEGGSPGLANVPLSLSLDTVAFPLAGE